MLEQFCGVLISFWSVHISMSLVRWPHCLLGITSLLIVAALIGDWHRHRECVDIVNNELLSEFLGFTSLVVTVVFAFMFLPLTESLIHPAVALLTEWETVCGCLLLLYFFSAVLVLLLMHHWDTLERHHHKKGWLYGTRLVAIIVGCGSGYFYFSLLVAMVVFFMQD